MQIYKLSLVTVLVLTGILGFAARVSRAEPTTQAAPLATGRAVIDDMTVKVLAVLRDEKLSKPERKAKVEAIADERMDFEKLSTLALGKYWRGLSPEQKTDFVKEFRKHLAATYGHTTDEYTDEDIKVLSERIESDGDSSVTTSIIGLKDGKRQEVAKVDYRLRKKADSWKIIDVNIDGVSLAMNFRSQFQDIMTNGGIEKLLKLLHEKNGD